MSALSHAVRDYLEMRRALGYKLTEHGSVLPQFIAFLEQRLARFAPRVRWFEEFADTRLGDLLIWSLFYQTIVRPLVWDEPTDEQRVKNALD